MEAAEKGTIDLKSENGTASPAYSIHKQSQVPQSNGKRTERRNYVRSSKTNNPRGSQQSTPLTKTVCYRCGGNHLASTCRCKEWECRLCKKKGHIVKVCRSVQGSSNRSHYVKQSQSEDTNHTTTEQHYPSSSAYSMFNTNSRSLAASRSDPLVVEVTLNSIPVSMELDTGASLSVINEDTYHRLCQSHTQPIIPSEVLLQTYMGEKIPIKGTITVTLEYNQFKGELSILVVTGTGPNLFGRDWLTKVNVNWANLLNVSHSLNQSTGPLKEVLLKFPNVFGSHLGCLKGVAVDIEVDPNASPRFHKARPVPLSYLYPYP